MADILTGLGVLGAIAAVILVSWPVMTMLSKWLDNRVETLTVEDLAQAGCGITILLAFVLLLAWMIGGGINH